MEETGNLKELRIVVKPKTFDRLEKIKRTQELTSVGEAVDWLVWALEDMNEKFLELAKGNKG